ncbi:hypothetical protein EV1_003583 [Malus domestica]
MCLEILSSRVTEIVPVPAFLLREAYINDSDLRRIINRRPNSSPATSKATFAPPSTSYRASAFPKLTNTPPSSPATWKTSSCPELTT